MKRRDKLLSTFRGGEISVSSGVPRFAANCGFVFATLILAGISWALWQSSFVAAEGVPALDLGYTPREVVRTPTGVIEEKKDSVRMTAAREVPRIELRWAQAPPARYAHVVVDVSCQGVVMGKNPWESARIFLMWYDGKGKLVEGHLPLWSGYHDQPRQSRDMMVPLARDGTLPRIIIENRGRAGVFQIHSLSVQPAELRPGFAWMLAAVLLAWAGLIGFATRRWVAKAGTPVPRIALTAVLWVGFAWISSFPGPWIPWHPLGKPFSVAHLSGATVIKPAPKPVEAPAATGPASTPVPGSPPVATAPKDVPASPVAPAAPPVGVQASGSVDTGPPERLGGGPVRWFLNHLPELKRVVHLLAFAGLAALMAFLTGSWRAAWPAFALGVLSEFSQWAFGFGFDRGDVIDLVFDAIAVLAGLAVWRWTRRLFAKRREPEAVGIQSPASNA